VDQDRGQLIRGRHPIVLAGVFAVSFALGKLSLTFTVMNGSTAVVWAPSGFALAAILLFGRGVWPAIFAATWVVQASATGLVGMSMSLGLGDTIEALIGAVHVDRIARGVELVRRPGSLFRFVHIAAGAAGLGSIVCVSSLAVGGVTPIENAQLVWAIWWLSHGVGLLLVTPIVLLWSTTAYVWIGWRRALELGLLAALFGGVLLLVFGGLLPTERKDYPLEFLCVPFLLWMAFRFERIQTSTALAILGLLTLWGTYSGFGPFVRGNAVESTLLVQAYLGVIAVMGIVLAAVVAEGRQAQAQLRELATTDPLTGLANYRRLLDVLRGEIARSHRTGREFAVLLVDMNGLKKINDRYGHLAGSRALCRVAQTLRATCRTTDTPARFGGDEFAVVLAETGDEGAQIVLQRVHERLARDTAQPRLSVSGGIAVFPRDGDSPTILLRAADQGLYGDKSASKKTPPPAAAQPKTGTLF
jgi:diguanylate cyclase (GGDEF)-like protein